MSETTKPETLAEVLRDMRAKVAKCREAADQMQDEDPDALVPEYGFATLLESYADRFEAAAPPEFTEEEVGVILSGLEKQGTRWPDDAPVVKQIAQKLNPCEP